MDGDTNGLQQALAKLLAIVDRLDARNLQTVQRVETAATAMEREAKHLNQGSARFAQEALQQIGADTRQTIANGAGEAVADFQYRLQQAANSLQWAAKAMDEERKRLAAARRSLVWTGALALLVGSPLAAGGAAWVAHRSMQDVAQAHFAADILQATQSGALTRCGETLCARVGKKPLRHGNDSEYAVLRP